jgi:prepilin-type N-terminal cleavage/methylation domain-containing protein
MASREYWCHCGELINAGFMLLIQVRLMNKEKGYTLAELLTVVIIVVVLASIGVAIFSGRIDSAKWSEGKARAGLIATTIRAWIAGYNMSGSWTEAPGSLDAGMLGFTGNDLEGKYFDESNFTWQVDYDGANLRYIITITKPDVSWKPDQMVLDNGIWIEGDGI